MDNTDWKYCYKMFRGVVNTTNALYTPTVNPEGNILCMHWDHTSPYQLNTRLTPKLVNFFFEREIKYLTQFQGKYYAPKILDIDYVNKKIFTDWNKDTLNTIMFVNNQNLDEVCIDWREQIYLIIEDIIQSGYYKTALYPHCFYLDSGIIKTFDFYGCVEKDNPYVNIADINGMIGSDSFERFASATVNGYLNVETFFKNSIKTHMGFTWPDNPFPEYYKRLFNEEF